MAGITDNDGFFVGRRDELDRWEQILTDPRGQAVLIVGHPGMGKTTLAERMVRSAEHHPDLTCGWVRHEITPTDAVAGTMALMIDHAFQAAQTVEGSFAGTPHRRRQWEALIEAVIPKGDKLLKLVNSLQRDVQRDTRDQFIDRLNLISELMPENGRALFVLDPEKYMPTDSDQAWAIVVRRLPDKIKLIIPQRAEDQLATSATFRALPNVLCIPDADLPPLDEQAVDDLLTHRAGELHLSIPDLRQAMRPYQGHPFALDGAFKLLAGGTLLSDLPTDPTPTGVAREQWRKVGQRGADALRLFKAYAMLEVAIPFDVVDNVAELDVDTRQALLADQYLASLLRDEADGRRIYHALFADVIRDDIGKEESASYHRRAVDNYRRRLTAEARPDPLAAARLPEHVLAVDGSVAFIIAFLKECASPLISLGLLDQCIALSDRALEHTQPGSAEQASLLGNLGVVMDTRGDLDGAEAMYRKAMAIHEKLGQLEGMAAAYGNLGIVMKTRGDLDGAEAMHRKALEINKKLERLEGMAAAYGNLGLVMDTRGDLDGAEAMYRKALGINDKLGRLEGMAINYGNLGIVMKTRGDLDGAETMYGKSLAINEKLGRLEGMAADYANLGIVMKIRGDLDGAKEMWKKSLAAYKRIGTSEMVKKIQGAIDHLAKSDND